MQPSHWPPFGERRSTFNSCFGASVMRGTRNSSAPCAVVAQASSATSVTHTRRRFMQRAVLGKNRHLAYWAEAKPALAMCFSTNGSARP
jgi:hypothetical protein